MPNKPPHHARALLALVFASGLALAACDGGDPRPDPDPASPDLDGVYAGSWTEGAVRYELELELDDDDGTLTGSGTVRRFAGPDQAATALGVVTGVRSGPAGGDQTDVSLSARQGAPGGGEVLLDGEASADGDTLSADVAGQLPQGAIAPARVTLLR